MDSGPHPYYGLSCAAELSIIFIWNEGTDTSVFIMKKNSRQQSEMPSAVAGGVPEAASLISDPLLSGPGLVKEILLAESDETESKRDEDYMRQSVDRYRRLVEVSPDAIYVNRRNLIEYVNPAALQLFGAKSPSQLLGRTMFDVFHPDFHAVIRERIGLLLSGEEVVPLLEEKIVRLDGTVVDVETLATSYYDQKGLAILVILRDISQRKQAEAEMRVGENRQRLLVEMMLQGVVQQSADGTVILMNPAAVDILGRTKDKHLGIPFFEDENYTLREDGSPFPGIEHPSIVALRTGQTVRGVIMRVYNPVRGDWRWLRVDAVPVFRSGQFQPAEVYAIFEDITSRRQAKEELRQSEQFARSQWAEAEATLEALPANVALLDETGKIVRVNHAWTAFARDNGAVGDTIAVGANYLEVCDRAIGAQADAAEVFSNGIRAVIRGATESFSMEYACHSSEKQRWYLASVTATRSESNARVVVAHIDITAQKLIEEQIRTLNQELEQRVLARTAEMQDALSALETEIAWRQRLEREILEISEREQSRLGQDLHDGIGQELAGTAMLGDVIAKKLQAEDHPMASLAGKVATHTRSIIDSARWLAKGLYPISLNRYGLQMALKDLAGQTFLRTGISCELIESGEAPQLPQSSEIHVYRIVQECISNAIKHGRAEHIIIESLGGAGEHTFSVTDDGVGFEKPAADHTGMGLYLMEYRARLIGARITIEKPEQGGCRVVCHLSDMRPQRQD